MDRFTKDVMSSVGREVGRVITWRNGLIQK